jgi:hypothetical protein
MAGCGYSTFNRNEEKYFATPPHRVRTSHPHCCPLRCNGERFSLLTCEAGVDSAWKQEEPEAKKMLENAAESPASSARFVSPRFIEQLWFWRLNKSYLWFIYE